ncbi:hypothetical protein D3C85_1569840 [compost metagenome]
MAWIWAARVKAATAAVALPSIMAARPSRIRCDSSAKTARCSAIGPAKVVASRTVLIASASARTAAASPALAAASPRA